MALPPIVCPRCRTGLAAAGDEVTCSGCGQIYRRDPHWDLIPGFEYSDDESAPCHAEEQGERLRTERFYLPLLRDLAARTGRELSDLRVLDDGCGWGAAVERLRAAGVDAVGLDVGWRSREWGHRDPPWPYLRADGRSLPFEDGTFDAVFSFGVIEHVGIEGESGASELVAPDYREQRARYVAEALRVLRPGGVAALTQPNGSCPVDFWHYAGRVPARLHSPRQPFLPRFSELREWALAALPGARVEALSPHRVLAFERIAHWWYGRLFTGLMRALFAAMRPRPLRFLARSALNPFVVALIHKPDRGHL